MKIYGTPLCPDVMDALAALDAQGRQYELIDITADLANLRAFLNLRDRHPLFEAVKEAEGIGIPAFVKEDGTLVLSLEEL